MTGRGDSIVGRDKHKKARLLAATVGSCGLVAMGVLTAVVGDPPTTGRSVAAGPMTRGETVTEVAATTTLPPSVLPTEKAVPAVKAKAYK
jgi:hypothetical protein